MFKSINKKIKAFFLSTAILLCFSMYNAYATSNLNLVNCEIDAGEKTAIITGANRGMGLGWVKHFLSEGYTVIATARKPDKATDLIELKKQFKQRLYVEKLDVTSEEDHAALGNMLKENNIKIHIAISNAGVTVEEDFGKWTSHSFLMNFKVNTMGAAFFAQTISPYLVEGARLVQLSSGHAAIGKHRKAGTIDAYGISKAGVNLLTKKLSLRWADRKIIVVSITPGGVKTDMNPWGKLSVAEAIPIMYETVSKLSIEHSGTFINNHGKVMEW